MPDKSDSNLNFTPADFRRLCWHSRRGMLELDLLLLPFAEHHLATLADAEIVLYRELLQEEDQDLYVWLTRRQPAPSAGLQQIVERILQFNAASYPGG